VGPGMFREAVLAKPAEAIDIAEMLSRLPRRVHDVIDQHAAQTPQHPALVENTVTWSYRELRDAVRKIAAALRSLGIRPGDRIMIVSENCIALAGLLFAASRIDAWAIVVNPRLSPRELDQISDHSGARRVLFTVGVSREAADHAARCEANIGHVGPLNDIGIGALNEQATAEPVEESSARQAAVLIYTSGTTGTPKGVMLTHENLLISAKTTAWFRKMDANDKVYVVLPISHIVGIITILNGVPATYQRLLEYKTVAGISRLDRGSLRLIAVAGAPLDLDLKSRVQRELGLSLLNGYGITECSPGISGVRIDNPRDDQAVGTLLPGIESRIVAPDGAPVPDGQVGELHVRGPNVMRGYYRAPDLTAQAIDAEGWFNTGDLARCDGDCLYIVGRTKEMIIRSGFNVYPAEVEAVLNSHDSVVQSAVVGRAVEGNEEVVAFVQLMQGATTSVEELKAHASSLLTSYKRPSEIVVLDALPATSTGKILKHRLAESLRGA
jgi:long-chain acyl-CoA synthetase